MRVVLDTNIFVSAIPGHTLQAIFDYWLADSFVLIVSGDKHLLDLKSYQSVRIISARDFLFHLSRES